MACINAAQTRRIAEYLRAYPDDELPKPLNYYSYGGVYAADEFPERDDPQTVNFLFFLMLQNFGFWYGNNHGWHSRLTGVLSGRSVSGSALLTKALKRSLDADPKRYIPQRLADMRPEELTREVLKDDNGRIPFPDLGIRYRMTTAYGDWFVRRAMEPESILKSANASAEPLKVFLEILRGVPGFDEDDLEKRNLLLALALASRPERYLNVTDPENWRPIVDYHLIRLALRIGLVDLSDHEAIKSESRAWAIADEERGIRQAAYDAIAMLIEESGKSMTQIDVLLWSGGRYCPEAREPECEKCVFNAVCKKRTKLFQPVYRTTAY